MKPENVKKLKEQIKRMEGYSSRPYKDSRGIWTVGWGHNLEASSEKIPDQIDRDLAELYFETDFASAHHDCRQRVPGFGALDDIRQAVLVNMAFNLGTSGLLKFRRMLHWISMEAWTGAAREMLDSKWAHQVGREGELVFMMLTGEWV